LGRKGNGFTGPEERAPDQLFRRSRQRVDGEPEAVNPALNFFLDKIFKDEYFGT